MAQERHYEAQGPFALTANGGADGIITLQTVGCLKVKQTIKLSSVSQQDLQVQIKRVLSPTQILVGPIDNNFLTKMDVSNYTVADNAAVFFNGGSKPKLKVDDIWQAVYEQEPTVALRTFSVDKIGRPWDVDNPFPVQLSDGSINIGTVNGELEVQLNHLDNDPDAGDVHDSVRIGGGQFEAEVDSDQNLHVEMHGNDQDGVDRVFRTSSRGELVSKDHKAQDTVEENNFAVTTALNSIAGTTETPYLLLRNPIGSGKTLRVFRSRTGVNSKTSASVFRTYLAPTITDLGTPLAIRNLYVKPVSVASVMEAYRFPILSSNGILSFITVVPSSFRTTPEDFDHYIILDPGIDVIITTQSDQNNTPVHIDLFWTEK